VLKYVVNIFSLQQQEKDMFCKKHGTTLFIAHSEMMQSRENKDVRSIRSDPRFKEMCDDFISIFYPGKTDDEIYKIIERIAAGESYVQNDTSQAEQPLNLE
jgi:hypothetical protein